MSYTAELSERLAIVATVDPDAYSANTYKTDVVDMKYFRRVLFVALCGDIGDGGTVDLTVYANASNSSTGGTAVSGKSFAAATFSGSGDSDLQGLIEVTAEETNAAVSGGRYLYAELVIAGASADAAVAVLAGDSRYGPASDYDLASVAEII